MRNPFLLIGALAIIAVGGIGYYVGTNQTVTTSKVVPQAPAVASPTSSSYDSRGLLLPEILSFSATSNFLSAGEPATLSWKAANVNYCELTSVEAWRDTYIYTSPVPVRVEASGERTYTPQKTTTYKLSCSGPLSGTGALGAFSPVQSSVRVFVPYSTTTPSGDGYACYSNTGNSILDGTSTLAQADPNTFTTIFNSRGLVCVGADKNHVYGGSSLLPWADPLTFDFLGFSQLSNRMFRNKNSIVDYHYKTTDDTSGYRVDQFFDTIIPNSDADSFSTLASDYEVPLFAIDKNNVYCWGKVIPGADPKTAESPDGSALSVRVNGVEEKYDGRNCKEIK